MEEGERGRRDGGKKGVGKGREESRERRKRQR